MVASRVVPMVTPAALALVGVLVFNRFGFGTWLPISGQVKAHSARLWISNEATVREALLCYLDVPWVGEKLVGRLFHGDPLVSMPRAGWMSVLLLDAALVVLALRHRRVLGETLRPVGGLFLILGAGLTLAADKLAVVFIAPWYEGPLFLSTAVVGAAICRERPVLVRLGIAASIAALLVRTPWLLWTLRDPEARYGAFRLQAGRWISEQTPPSARIGSWNAGVLGYFAHRSVVNLDGLVADADYFRRVIERKELTGYLVSERIGWLADQSCGASPRPAAYLARSGSERLDPEFTLVQAFFRAGGDNCPGYAIWRWNRPTPETSVPALDSQEPEAIDTVMKLGMNHPMGPLTWRISSASTPASPSWKSFREAPGQTDR